MRILIFGDNHFSTYSSIVRKRGEEFSTRLENQINSLNWVESVVEQRECDLVVCLGDFFDKPELTAEEITALQEVIWADAPHLFLVGNHEGMVNDLSTSSAHLFNMIPNARVISEPEEISVDNINMLFLPYILESERKPIESYTQNKSLVCFSHNDIKGINYGAFESQEGFHIDNIMNTCKYFFNGHIHNNSEFAKNCFNVGNLTGQNFGEDAYKYDHNIAILDTNSMQVEWIENPYAFNFYKLEITSFDQLYTALSTCKTNAVMSVKAPEELVTQVRELLQTNDKIVEYRVISSQTTRDSLVNSDVCELTTVNHLDQFYNYVVNNISSSEIMLSELAEVCR